MQVITPARTNGRAYSRWSVLSGIFVGTTLMVGAGLLAYLTFGTEFLDAFMPTGRADPAQMVTGMLAWTFALTAPAGFGLVGLVRLATVVDRITSSQPRKTPAMRLAKHLGDDLVLASRVVLPDTRTVPEIVLGPYGAAILEELPPKGATRHQGPVWEVRMGNRWIPWENPLDRASRDAERVRRWFAHDDRDFVVKVYAAVVAADPGVERTASCAVISPGQIPAWLASLPAQRGLTPARREKLTELVRAAV